MMVVFAACVHEEPNVIYMPDMVYGPAIKAQKVGSMRMPVEGTIPRNWTPYPYDKFSGGEQAGKDFKNPLQPSTKNLARGKHVFETFCTVCHGVKGHGDGPIIPKFPMPPSLHSEKIRTWPDGRIYHVVTSGQGIMPTYAPQIAPEDRWALIHYIRQLQRSEPKASP